jgi:hypothetical protein
MIRSIEDKGGEEDKGKPCIPFYGIIGALLVVETPEPHLCRIASSASTVEFHFGSRSLSTLSYPIGKLSLRSSAR